jgi:hypothetical protein
MRCLLAVLHGPFASPSRRLWIWSAVTYRRFLFRVVSMTSLFPMEIQSDDESSHSKGELGSLSVSCQRY